MKLSSDRSLLPAASCASPCPYGLHAGQSDPTDGGRTCSSFTAALSQNWVQCGSQLRKEMGREVQAWSQDSYKFDVKILWEAVLSVMPKAAKLRRGTTPCSNPLHAKEAAPPDRTPTCLGLFHSQKSINPQKWQHSQELGLLLKPPFLDIPRDPWALCIEGGVFSALVAVWGRMPPVNLGQQLSVTIERRGEVGGERIVCMSHSLQPFSSLC